MLYRKIFPSYDWDEDVAYVNQIINYPKIVGVENAGFMKNAPNEEIKKSDEAIANWITKNMNGCSCYVLFVGERTYLSRWVHYEMELACQLNLGILVIFLDGMKDLYGKVCGLGIDPFAYHGMYSAIPSPNLYLVKQYHWTAFSNPYELLPNWIEDACQRAGR